MSKKINMKFTLYCLEAITFILSIATLYCFFHLTMCYKGMQKNNQKYFQAEYYTSEFMDATLYLSEKAQLYVINQDVKYIDQYFNELSKNFNRQIAVAKLDEIISGDEIITEANSSSDYLMQSLIFSDELALMETHAMKLVALANNIDMKTLSTEIQVFYIPDYELALSPAKKIEQAKVLVFGEDYQNLQHKVIEYQKLANDGIINLTKNNQTESTQKLSRAITFLHVFSFLLILMILILFCILYFFVIKPLDRFVECIKNDKPLENVRSKELGYLATTYNRINEIREDNNMFLKEKAERDPLTKLYNRSVFQQNSLNLKDKPIDIIIVLFDIDKFKSINDNYGHDIGDKILIKCSYLMRDKIGGDQDTYRIGGDEFVIIVRNKDTSYFENIKNKIDEVNSILQNPEDGLPAVSISAGIAFSDSGYSEVLMKNADQALYNSKENGRCTVSFFEDNLEEL